MVREAKKTTHNTPLDSGRKTRKATNYRIVSVVSLTSPQAGERLNILNHAVFFTEGRIRPGPS